MKCCNCKFAPAADAEGYEDECGYFEKYGKEFSDGEPGCTLPYNRLKKLDREYTKHLENMGIDMGIEIVFEQNNVDIPYLIKYLKHMIGMDSRNPYTRHGKMFYKAYRNYDCHGNKPNKTYELLCNAGLMECELDNGCYTYSLTELGLSWFSRFIKINCRLEY